jgi:stearoyl-CoA 9-desaturase NADPH oxidoreductase
MFQTTTRPGRLLAAVDRIGTALTTPLLPEDVIGLVNPLWSTSTLRGRVVGTRRETARATTLRIRPGRGWTGHRAGQYVRVGVDVNGVRHWRSYSISAPEGPGDLEVTVQAQPGGTVSPALAHHTPVGALVHLEPAAGEFTLPRHLPDRLLMLTAGSGITPVMAILRTLATHAPMPDTVLLHSARTPDDVIFGAELRTLAARHPRIRLVERHTASDGRLDLAELAGACPDWAAREAYACGPEALLDAAEAHWADRPGRLRTERFTPPARSAGGSGGTVGYGSGPTVSLDGTTSLLEAGEAAGVLLPSGCRMGICKGCVLPLRDGQVRDLRTGEVHGEPGDLVQTCVNGASGAARLDV